MIKYMDITLAECTDVLITTMCAMYTPISTLNIVEYKTLLVTEQLVFSDVMQCMTAYMHYHSMCEVDQVRVYLIRETLLETGHMFRYGMCG